MLSYIHMIIDTFKKWLGISKPSDGVGWFVQNLTQQDVEKLSEVSFVKNDKRSKVVLDSEIKKIAKVYTLSKLKTGRTNVIIYNGQPNLILEDIKKSINTALISHVRNNNLERDFRNIFTLTLNGVENVYYSDLDKLCNLYMQKSYVVDDFNGNAMIQYKIELIDDYQIFS